MKAGETNLRDGTVTRCEYKLKVTKTSAIKLIADKVICRLPAVDEINFEKSYRSSKHWVTWEFYDILYRVTIMEDAGVVRMRVYVEEWDEDDGRYEVIDDNINTLSYEDCKRYNLLERKAVR